MIHQLLLASQGKLVVTGGVVTEVGGYRIHTFTADSQMTVSGFGEVETFALGGGGGGSRLNFKTNGGGAASKNKQQTLELTAGIYDIVVGIGGAGVFGGAGLSGGDTKISKNGVDLVVSTGGTGGATNGGSNDTYSGGGYTGGGEAGPGGAGSRGNGGNNSGNTGGTGGPGFTSSFNGIATTYAGGGGGAGHNPGFGQSGGGNGIRTGNGGNASTYGSGGGAGRDGAYRGGYGFQGIFMLKYPI